MEPEQDKRVIVNAWLNRQRMERAPDSEVNCVAFTASGVEAVTGINPASKYLTGTIAESYKAMRRDGYENLSDYLASIGEEVTPVALAQVADVAVMEDLDGNEALGLVIGAYVAALDREGNIVNVPLTASKKVFRL